MADGEPGAGDELSGSSPTNDAQDSPQALSQADLLAGPGLRGALFAQWGRQKRRTALQQRYGEEAEVLAEDGLTGDLYEWND